MPLNIKCSEKLARLKMRRTHGDLIGKNNLLY